MNPFRRLLPAGAILLSVVAAGITGFMWIEHWDLLDSVYMVVITLFTIGFREVHPLSGAGRVLTMFIAVLGVGTALYAAGQTMEIIVEGELLGYRKRKQMERRIAEMKGHYLICGYGRIGHRVATEFSAAGIAYVVLDSKEETIQELEPRGVPYLIGDMTGDEILEEAGIRAARGMVACADSDVANVYVTLSARALNPRLFIVARAALPETERKLTMAGANRVVSPYQISARRMAALVTQPVTSDFLDMVTHGGTLEFRLDEIPVPAGSPLLERTLSESQIRTRSGALVLAIRKADGSFDMQPTAASVIQQGDTLVVIGTQEQIAALERMLV